MESEITRQPDASHHKKPTPPPPPPIPSSTAYTLVTEPNQGLASIYNLLSSAKKSIDMTMYELNDSQVTTILATVAANGVTVRVILDQNNEKASNTAAYNPLTAAKVSVHWANPAYACTHQKTITVDQATSAIMTLNLTSEDYATTRDFAVITNDPADVAAIETTGGPAGVFTHFATPAALLEGARSLYGARPQALLITVVGLDFELGEKLSEPVQLALESLAGGKMRELLAGPPPQP